MTRPGTDRLGTALIGPRWSIAGPQLDGPPTLFTQDTGNEVIEVHGAASARRVVGQVKRVCGDFVRVSSRLFRPGCWASRKAGPTW
jgi:hypothetical protein